MTPTTSADARLSTGIRRVSLCCDILRFSLGREGYRSGQIGNLRWLAAVLGATTDWPGLGIDVRWVGPAADEATLRRQVRSAAVLREYELDPLAAWARRYDDPDCDVHTGLADELLDSDLVIGFELPRGMRRMLDAHGRAYISFHIHALRFLRDLCLGAATNSSVLAAQLARVTLPDAEVRSQTRRFAALLGKNRWPAFEVPADWPLLIGQTAHDAVLIEQGRFVDWAEHDEDLAASLGSFEGCVLLEHPHRRDSAAIAQHVRALTGKPVVMTNANAYGTVFGGLGRPLAVTLASSLGVEAQAAGIPTTFLLGDPRQRPLLAGVDVGTTGALHHGVLAPEFWRSVFTQPAAEPRLPWRGTPFELGDNHLRLGLESWAYGALKRGLPEPRARKVLFCAEGMATSVEAPLLQQLSGETEPAQGWRRIDGAAPGDLGVELVRAPPPPGLGERCRIAVGDAWSPLRLTGFHAPEPWGAWSAQPEARVAVALGASAVSARASVEVQLTLSVFEDLRPRHPVCRVTCGGRTLALVYFRPAGPYAVEVSVTTPAEAPWCELSLHMNDIDSPQRTRGSADARSLGVGLLAVNVTVVAGPLGPVDAAPLQRGVPAGA